MEGNNRSSSSSTYTPRKPLRKIRCTKYKQSLINTKDETNETERNWVCKATGAKSLECQNLVKLLCGVTPDKQWTILKGRTYLYNQKLSTLFEDHVKLELSRVINITD